MKIKNPEDALAGVLFALTGSATLAIAIGYRVGVASQMGPGYFPAALGLCLVLLGLLIFGTSFFSAREEAVLSSFRALLFVAGSIFLFAALLPRLGLVVTVFVVTVVSSFARRKPDLRATAILGMMLALACYAIFVFGLDLRLQVWPRL